VGGTIGAFLTGIFATVEANANLATNLDGIVGHTLWIEQLKSMVLTLVLAIGASFVIGLFVRATVGLRPAPEVERQGLDIHEHGEQGYMYGEAQ
jgi:Amt family ammonium transporter